MKKIVILGAGLTGLSTAYFLQKSNISYTIIEKERETGGLCRTIDIQKYKFDFTGHLLHLRNRGIKNFIFKDLDLEDEFQTLRRNSKIYYKDKLIDYPFQANIDQLHGKDRDECIDRYFSRNQNIRIKTFKDWIKKYFGDGLGKHFFYPYNEKLWLSDLDNILPDWTGRFIPEININKKINKNDIGYNTYFYYPKNTGIKILPDRIANTLKKDNIILDKSIDKIDISKKTVCSGNDIFKYDVLINTIPLNNLLDNANITHKLRIISVLNINIGFKGKTNSNIHWIYFPEKKYSFYRVGYYSHFNNNMSENVFDSIYIEISCTGNPGIKQTVINSQNFKTIPQNIKHIINNLIDVKIIPSMKSIDIIHINPIHSAYVLYDLNWKDERNKYLNHLEKNNIYSIGRYGNWVYSSMEDNIIQAWETVEKIKKTL
jgi:protoporphyrinogen oxidase